MSTLMTGEGSTGGGRRFGGSVVSVSPQQLHITTLETACRHDSEQAYPKLKSETRSQSQRQGQSCEAHTLPTPHSKHTQTHTHTLQTVCTLYIVHFTTHEGSWSAFVFVANLDPYPHLFIYVFNLSFFSIFCPVFALNLHVFYIPICSLLKYKLKLLLLLMLLLLLLLLYHCIAFTVCGQTSLSLFMICF